MHDILEFHFRESGAGWWVKVIKKDGSNFSVPLTTESATAWKALLGILEWTVETNSIDTFEIWREGFGNFGRREF